MSLLYERVRNRFCWSQDDMYFRHEKPVSQEIRSAIISPSGGRYFQKIRPPGDRFPRNITLLEFCPPPCYRSSHGIHVSKFKDFFMRISFAARISQFENDKTEIRKRFQQNVQNARTLVPFVCLTTCYINVMCNSVL